MNLKYERQWEIIEKRIRDIEYGRNINYYHPITWTTKAAIINEIFKAYYFMDYDILANFESNARYMKLYDWEYQQKPLLDKMIEVILLNKEK